MTQHFTRFCHRAGTSKQSGAPSAPGKSLTGPNRRSSRARAALLAGSISLALALGGPHPGHAAGTLDEIVLPQGFAYPNGIARAADGALFVGSVTSGDILRVAPDGTSETWHRQSDTVFAGTALRLDAATGILWVASPDFLGQEVNGETVRRPHRVAAIDTSTGREVWSSAMPDGGFANDFALDGSGGIFITDTLRDRVLRLAGPGASFETVAESPQFTPGAIGPAGIVALLDGDLVVGLYSNGSLLRVSPDGADATVTRLDLERSIENPDGLALAPDGRLLVLEGAVASGDGKLLAIDLAAPPPLAIEVLADGLDMPLNLTQVDGGVAITEGRLRHRMIDDATLPVPTDFRVVIVPLNEW